ncbi:MAG: type II toxin-antitoxin system Phd/YefM family antitoxin [Spirochaetia bacterium]|jgi:antitoxin Phd|nr:type II toxin-antitoxin system Phd/YefM family antitoxin [Spirochaetia bacterium]
MTTTWKLQDAKAKFSKIVEDALKIGPQLVTRRGVEAVVVLSIDKYKDLISDKPSFKDFLLNCPKMETGFEFERQKDFPGDIEL